MGAFDDLIPEPESADSASGAFDDLIPKQEPVRGAFSDLIPERKDPTTYEVFRDDLNRRAGTFNKAVIGVVPSALRLAGAVEHQLGRPLINRTREEYEADLALWRQTNPEDAALSKAGNFITQKLTQMSPPLDEPDVWDNTVQGAGQLTGMLAGGGAIKLAGASLPVVTAGASTMGGIQEFDDAYLRSRERGDDPDTAFAKSLGYATVSTLIENKLGAGRLLRQIIPDPSLLAKKLTALGVSKTVAGNFVAGGLEEGSQRWAQNLIIEGKPSMEGVMDEAIPGAIVQGFVGAPGGVSQNLEQDARYRREQAFDEAIASNARKVSLDASMPRVGTGERLAANRGKDQSFEVAGAFDDLIPKNPTEPDIWADEDQSPQSQTPVASDVLNTELNNKTSGAVTATSPASGASTLTPEEAATPATKGDLQKMVADLAAALQGNQLAPKPGEPKIPGAEKVVPVTQSVTPVTPVVTDGLTKDAPFIPGRDHYTDRRKGSETEALSFTVPEGSKPDVVQAAFEKAKQGYEKPNFGKPSSPTAKAGTAAGQIKPPVVETAPPSPVNVMELPTQDKPLDVDATMKAIHEQERNDAARAAQEKQYDAQRKKEQTQGITEADGILHTLTGQGVRLPYFAPSGLVMANYKRLKNKLRGNGILSSDEKQLWNKVREQIPDNFEDQFGVDGYLLKEAYAAAEKAGIASAVFARTDKANLRYDNILSELPREMSVAELLEEVTRLSNQHLANKGKREKGYEGLTEREIADVKRGEQLAVDQAKVLEDFGNQDEPKTPTAVEQSARTKQDSETLRRIVSSRPGLSELVGLTVVGDGAGTLRPGRGTESGSGGQAATRRFQSKDAAELERLFGVRIILVRRADGIEFNGYFARGEKTILIDADTQHPLLAVAGHELLHHIKQTHPGLYADLVERLSPMVSEAQLESFRNRLSERGQGGLSNAGVSEELIADFIGDNFLRPEFWNDLAKRDPNLFKRLARIVKTWLDKLIAKAKAIRGFESSQHFSDLEQAREVVADVLARAARETQFAAKGVPGQEMAAEEAFSKPPIDMQSGRGVASLRETETPQTKSNLPDQIRSGNDVGRRQSGRQAEQVPTDLASALLADADAVIGEIANLEKLRRTTGEPGTQTGTRATNGNLAYADQYRQTLLKAHTASKGKDAQAALQDIVDAHNSDQSAYDRTYPYTKGKTNDALQQGWERRLQGSADAIATISARLKEFSGEGKPFRASNATVTPPGLVDMGMFSKVAHHGTPHKVDKFSTDKIGTGEGAQVYGWGLYFAENPEVAKNYAETLGNRMEVRGVPVPDRRELMPTHAAVDSVGELEYILGSIKAGSFSYTTHGPILDKALMRLDKALKDYSPGSAAYESVKKVGDWWDSIGPINAINQHDVKYGRGREYTVSLAVEDDDLLDWDKPLSEQSEKVNKAFASALEGSRWEKSEWPQTDYKLVDKHGNFILSRPAQRETNIGNLDGATLYRVVTSADTAKAASEYLASLGIKGIRYLDQGSRVASNAELNDLKAKLAHSLQKVEQWQASNQDVELKARQIAMHEADAKHFQTLVNNATKPTYNYVIFSGDDITITHENGKEVTAHGMFSKPSRADFSFDAPESVAEQKARLAAEKRATGQAVAKTAMQGRAGAKLTGSDLDSTGEMFGQEVKQDKDGQLGMFSKPEQEKNLVAVHNIRAEGLRHVMKMGGLAAPSVAIVRADKAVIDGFGDITLVGNPNLIDPKENKSSRVFNADVYSPRYPKVTTIFKPGDSRKVSNAFDKYRAELSGVEMGKWSWNPNNIVETITDRGVADLEYNSLAMYAFARDKGLIEPQTGESNDVSEIVRQATKSRTDEVAPWFQSKLSDIGVTPDEKIFDGFTNMGNRRYLKHDLDTVVKILKRKLQDGEGFNYGVPSVRATVAKRFRTLKQIQDSRDSIIPKDAMEALKNEANTEFESLHTEAMPHRDGGKNSGFGTMDAFSDDLKAMAEGGSENWRHLREMYPGGEPFPKMREFLEKLRNMPTEYFESKIQRAVQLQEFSGAVVPEGTSPELVQQLEKRGLTVSTYKKGDVEDRRRAVQQLASESGGLFSKPTGIKNAAMEDELADVGKLGLPGFLRTERKSNQTLHDTVTARIADEPGWIDTIIEREKKQPSSLTDEEVFALSHRLVELSSAHSKASRKAAAANDAGDMDTVVESGAQANALSDKIKELADITKESGTIAGRALQARARLFAQDFSLVAMEAKKREANDWAPLTAEQRADIQKQHDAYEAKIAELEQHLEETTGQLIDEELRRAKAEEEAAALPRYDARVIHHAEQFALAWHKVRIKEEADLMAMLKDSETGGMFSKPSIGDRVTKLARYIVEDIVRGVKKAEILEQLKNKFGASVESKFEAIWAEANSQMEKSLSKADKAVPDIAEKIKRVVKRKDAAEREAEARSQIETMIAKGEAGAIFGAVQKMIRSIVEQNRNITREGLIDEVHNTLKEFMPDITRLEAMDAISGRGRFTLPSSDEVSTIVRDLKAQTRLVGHQIDVQAKRPLPRTGFQPGQQSDAVRREAKILEELKRRFGVVVSDPTKQLASVLTARKTYYRNRLADMAHEIKTRELTVKTKSPEATDAELESLKAEYKALKAEHESIFTKPGLTDAQRLELSEKSADRHIAELERQLRTGEIFAPGKKPAGPTSAALEAKKARIEALKAEREWARDLLQPKPQPLDVEEQRRAAALDKRIEAIESQIANETVFAKGKTPRTDTPENQARLAKLEELKQQRQFIRERLQPKPEIDRVAQALKQRQASLTRQIADYADRLARGDFAKRTRKVLDITQDTKAMALMAQRDAIKKRFEKGVFDDRMARRTRMQKLFYGIRQSKDAMVNIMSSGDLSAPRQLFNYFLDASTRLATSPRAGLEMFKQPLGKMFQAAWSEDKAGAIEQWRLNQPNAKSGAYKIMGIEFSDLHAQSFSKQEEFAHSILDDWAALPFKTGNAAKSVITAPGKAGARMVRVSNRAFISALNVARVMLANELLKANFSHRAPTDAELRAIGNLVNLSTGRGAMNTKVASVTSNVLWSPKLAASRLQVLIGQPLWGKAGREGGGTARKMVLQWYVRQLVAAALLATIVRMFKDDDDDELSSSDAGKVKRGRTRIDPWMGYAQFVVLADRLIESETTSTTTGKTRKLAGGGNLEVIGRFLANKTRPDIVAIVKASAYAFDKARGEEKPRFTGEEVIQSAIPAPLALQEVIAIMRENGMAEGAIIQVLAQFGVGVSVYEDREKQK